MKKILLILCVFPVMKICAQDFAKDMTKAKSSYNANNLEEAHFALQQAMQEIDLIVGKEILKLLPAKMDTMAFNTKEDNVSTNIGFLGATIRRSYGKSSRKADVSIISNSPMIAMVNSLLNSPVMGMGNDGKSKTVKVQGYKARLERQDGNIEGTTNYELQVPLGSALITFKVDNCSDTQALSLAETIPLAEIAKLIQ